MADNDPTPAPADPADPPATDPAPEPAAPEPEFTPITSQEDFDRKIQERLRRQRAQFPTAEELETLKAKAAKADELEQAQMTEVEKANARAAQLEQDLAEATLARQESLLRSAVVSEAAKRNVVDPDAAIALIDRASLEFDDTGNPTNIAETMDSLLEAKPYLAGRGGTRGSADLGARGGVDDKSQFTRDQLKTMSPDEIVKARKEGRLDAVARGEA